MQQIRPNKEPEIIIDASVPDPRIRLVSVQLPPQQFRSKAKFMEALRKVSPNRIAPTIILNHHGKAWRIKRSHQLNPNHHEERGLRWWFSDFHWIVLRRKTQNPKLHRPAISPHSLCNKSGPSDKMCLDRCLTDVETGTRQLPVTVQSRWKPWSRQKEWWNVENALSIFFQGGIVDNEFTWVKERLFVSQNGNGRLHDMAENRPSISLEAR